MAFRIPVSTSSFRPASFPAVSAVSAVSAVMAVMAVMAILLALGTGGALSQQPASGGGASATTPSPAANPGSPFPLRIVTTEGGGPALYTSAAADAPAIGYVSGRVPIELVEAPANGRALVRIRGGMRVRAYLDAARVGAIVQRRGRLRGTPAYLGGGDMVQLLGFEPDGRARITAHVAAGTRRVAYTGSYPAAGIGGDAPAPAPETTPPGEPALLRAMTPLRVLEAAGGALIETLPAGNVPCRLMATEPGGYSVLIGSGPYLAGFVTEPPTPGAGAADARPSDNPGAVPERLRADTHLTLVRVAAGTRVTFEGQTIAVLDSPALARIVERHAASDEVDVFIAVDDTLAVRGIIPTAAVGVVVP